MRLLDKLYYQNLKPGLPDTIMVEPTNTCNFKCFMCDYQKQFEGKRSYLSIKDFESIIAQFPKIKGLILCGLGEPLLNKDTVRMVGIAAKRKIPFINLVTNGTLLNEECFKTLMESGLTRIQISFHSTNPAIASRINGVSSDVHSLVHTNIINALKIRNASNSSLQVVLNSVINIDNCEDLFNLIDFSEANKVDEINFIQLTTVFGKYDSFNIPKDRARFLIGKIRERLKNSYLKATFLSGNGAGRCYQMWNFIMIHADGKISPCNGIMPHENRDVGNLICNDISKIWHSDEYVKLRDSVVKGCLSNCRYCEVGYLLEGRNLEWINNYYLKPLARNIYSYIRND